MITIYNKFVKDEKDVEGMLAFSLFIHHEKQYITQFIKDYKAENNGQPPSSDIIQDMFLNLLTQSLKNTCRKEAVDILSITTANLKGQYLNQLEVSLSKSHLDKALKDCLTDINFMNIHKQFLKENLTSPEVLKKYESSLKQSKTKTVVLNILSTLLLALLIFVFLIIVHLFRPDSSEITRNILRAFGLVG